MQKFKIQKFNFMPQLFSEILWFKESWILIGLEFLDINSRTKFFPEKKSENNNNLILRSFIANGQMDESTDEQNRAKLVGHFH